MHKPHFKNWKIAIIYLAFFLGVKNMLSVALNLLLLPFLPSLLTLLNSPNYLFSPASMTSLLLQFIGFFIAIMLSSQYTKLLIAIKTARIIAVYATLYYITYTVLPTARFLVMNTTARKYFFPSQQFPAIVGINLVLFILFFFLSSYFLQRE